MNDIELFSKLVTTLKEATADKQRFVQQESVDKQLDQNVKKNTSKITDFGVLPDGGIYTKLSGHPTTWKGIADEEAVLESTVFKRFIPLALKHFKFFEKRSVWSLIQFLFFTGSIDLYLKFSHDGLRKYFLKPERYTRPVREIHRVLTWASELPELKKFKGMIQRSRDLVCYFVEYDNAYRFRGYDFGSIAREKQFKVEKSGNFYLKLTPLVLSLLFKKTRGHYFKPKTMISKEIHRIFGEVMNRDYKEMNVKWKAMRSVLCFAIDHSPYSKSLQKILAEVNWTEMKPTKEDFYWLTFNGASYNFGGLNSVQLNEWREKHYPGYPIIESEMSTLPKLEDKVFKQGLVPIVK